MYIARSSLLPVGFRTKQKKGARKFYCYECVATDEDCNRRLTNKTKNGHWRRPCETCMAKSDFLWVNEAVGKWEVVPREFLVLQNLLAHIYQSPDPPLPGMEPQWDLVAPLALQQVPANEAQEEVPLPWSTDATGHEAPHVEEEWSAVAANWGAEVHTAVAEPPGLPAPAGSSSNDGLTQPAVRSDHSDSEDTDDEKAELRRENERLRSMLATEKQVSAGLMRTDEYMRDRVSAHVSEVNAKVKALEKNQHDLGVQVHKMSNSIDTMLNLLKTQSHPRSRSASSRRSRRRRDHAQEHFEEDREM